MIRPRFFAQFACVAVLTVLLVGTGCSTTSQGPRVPNLPAPPYAPRNVFTIGQLEPTFVRVAVLPARHLSDDADTRLRTDEALVSELGRTRRFEVVPVSRSFLREHFGREQFDSTETLPDALFLRLKEEWGVDGVLFSDITDFRPYRPVSLGLRSKLVSIHDNSLLWVFDDVFNAGDPSVQSAVRQHVRGADRERFPLDASEGTLQSPIRFLRYVAATAYQTLPKR